MHTVAVIIPAFRERHQLERCLAHLREQSYRSLDVFVRDNTEDNIHFTAAVNEGLQKFCYQPGIDYVIVLNQDAYLAADAIDVLVDFLDRTPRCGIACPVHHDANGQVTWSGSRSVFPVGTYRRDDVSVGAAPFETPWAAGAAMAVRTAVVREVGLFDSNLRFVYSDADFSFSARARGWSVQVVPAARCEHTLNRSSGVDDLELLHIKVADALYFGRKWVTGELYRRLAQERPPLTAADARAEIEQLERVLAAIELTLSGANRTTSGQPASSKNA